MPDLLAARSQMAMSLAFHIILAVVGIAMPLMMVLAERRWLKGGDPVALDLANAQYPYMIPPTHTIASMAAPAVTLRLAVIGLAGGTVVLVPSLWYLFHVFKGERSALRPLEEEH